MVLGHKKHSIILPAEHVTAACASSGRLRVCATLLPCTRTNLDTNAAVAAMYYNLDINTAMAAMPSTTPPISLLPAAPVCVEAEALLEPEVPVEEEAVPAWFVDCVVVDPPV